MFTNDWNVPLPDQSFDQPPPSTAEPALPPLNYEELGNKLPSIDWSAETLANLQPYTANQVHKQPTDTIKTFMNQYSITCTGFEPNPILKFEDLDLPEAILNQLKVCKFEAPTTVQSLSWPAALGGRDVLCVACTGSGKTLAYLLPSLLRASAPGTEGVTSLILVPTRELAKQIVFESRPFSEALGMGQVCLYGGNSKKWQLKDMECNPKLVVGTPGRILDFLEEGSLSLKHVSIVTVDEADKMIDMGFGNQLKKILSQIRPDHQTILCTATWSIACSEISTSFLNDPITINVGSREIPTNTSITQVVKVVNYDEKLETLVSLLKKLSEQRVLLFVDTRNQCNELAQALAEHGIIAGVINGDKGMKERMSALLEFRAGRKLVLIATDVASRGIDIKDLNHVIVYDFPRRMQDYVYRIGRTGRAGTNGTATVLFTQENSKNAQAFITFLRENNQFVPKELLRFVARRSRSRSPRI